MSTNPSSTQNSQGANCSMAGHISPPRFELSDPRFIRKKCVGTGAIIGDGDRKSWDPRGPMIWDNFLFLELIIYMKKLLDSDWLRAVQFFLNTVQKRGN